MQTVVEKKGIKSCRRDGPKIQTGIGTTDQAAVGVARLIYGFRNFRLLFGITLTLFSIDNRAFAAGGVQGIGGWTDLILQARDEI